jgi:hypothetical protein
MSREVGREAASSCNSRAIRARSFSSARKICWESQRRRSLLLTMVSTFWWKASTSRAV